MRFLKKLAILSVCVVALSGCTEKAGEVSTEDTEAVTEAAADAMDPAKAEDMEDDDETLPRDKNFLIEEETEKPSLFEWDQVSEEYQDLFNGNAQYPQGESVDFTADEDALTVKLIWNVKDDTDEETAMNYAADLVKKFNDIAAIQRTDFELSSEDSFGGLWDTFALTVEIRKADGTAILTKEYRAGDKIDLVAAVYDEVGPTSGEDDE